MKTVEVKRRPLPYQILEELKSLRTNILFCGDDKKVILITSCIPGEGKTTISIELARQLSAIGKRVLYIDTDLRKSAVKERFEPNSFDKGLAHYLSGQASLDEIIYQHSTSCFYVIPAGVYPPNPSELLASKKMCDVMSAFREAYDYIIVDTAPLGIVSDAAAVAQYCDGTIMVVESGCIDRRMAREVKLRLEGTKKPFLGVILNKVDTDNQKYTNKKYYKYGKNSKYYRYGYV